MPDSHTPYSDMSGLVEAENKEQEFRKRHDESIKFKNWKSLPIWKDLDAITNEEIQSLQQELKRKNKLSFDAVFAEPIGYHFVKCYLETQHSVDKAIFIRDIQTFKTMTSYDERKETSRKIFLTFCCMEPFNRERGTSCLTNQHNIQRKSILLTKGSMPTDMETSTSRQCKFEVLELSTTEKVTEFQSETDTKSDLDSDQNAVMSSNPLSAVSNDHSLIKCGSIKCNDINCKDLKQIKEIDAYGDNTPYSQIDGKLLSMHNVTHNDSSLPNPQSYTPSSSNKVEPSSFSFLNDNANVIGCYGKPVRILRENIDAGHCDVNIFDDVLKQILNDLKLDVFPRFIKSKFFEMYLRCKMLEKKTFLLDNFQCLRTLGRGAFGVVNACRKRDTGKLYAMKQIDKRRVQATDSVQALISEKDFLSRMDSIFVTSLKYSFTTDDRLYLIMDLMTGGDLKFHLNDAGTFEETRVRFYAAQILLGLEHIHSRGIIYRDLKLENVLVDIRGHVKLSDLGLAVLSNDFPYGYAGTPGYTAPEVVLPQFYTTTVDFFSLGVMIYRTLCGKKPFVTKGSNNRRNTNKQKKKSSAELDRNVVMMVPTFDNTYFNPITKNICRALMFKDAKHRLGANGFGEIKEHPWFDCIDWTMMESGHLVSPYIPRPNQISSESEMKSEIGDGVPGDDKYKSVCITSEFDDSLREFTFKSDKVIQSEIVDVLEFVYLSRKMEIDEENYHDLKEIFAFPKPSMSVPVRKKRHCLSGCVIV